MNGESYLEMLAVISKKLDKALRLNDLIMERMDILESQRLKINRDVYDQDEPDYDLIEANERAYDWNEVLNQKRDRLWQHHHRVCEIAEHYTNKAFEPIRSK